jgi:anti-anti-sigma regulatory factor
MDAEQPLRTAERLGLLSTRVELADGNAVLRLSGLLDARTYRQVRDAVIKAAIDQPTAVIVDVDQLDVPDPKAWVVFTSARWHVHQWPRVAVALACSDPGVRETLADMSIPRYVPVFTDVATAAQAVSGESRQFRRRASRKLGPHEFDMNLVQFFVTDHLRQWSKESKIPVVLTVATIFVENALTHTNGGCDLRLESVDEDLVVAVSDTSATPAIRRERAPDAVPSGLDVVAAICQHWGCSPTLTGKTVWARIRPDDTLSGISQLLQP